MNIKAFSAACALALAASTANAGGLLDEIVEPEVEEAAPMAQPSSSGGILIPLVLVALLVAVASGDSGGGS